MSIFAVVAGDIAVCSNISSALTDSQIDCTDRHFDLSKTVHVSAFFRLYLADAEDRCFSDAESVKACTFSCSFRCICSLPWVGHTGRLLTFFRRSCKFKCHILGNVFLVILPCHGELIAAVVEEHESVAACVDLFLRFYCAVFLIYIICSDAVMVLESFFLRIEDSGHLPCAVLCNAA